MSCVSLLLLLCLLLLAALDPFAATAHRELLMAATGDEEAKLARTEMAAKDAEKEATSKRKEGSTNWHRFKTRKLPSDAKNRFYGRVPFTADYFDVHSHPSKHH